MGEMKFRNPYEETYRHKPKPPSKKTGSWRTQRPVINVEKCCQCGWCYLYCILGCIESKGDFFVPNLDYCKGCGVCAKECPVSAIKMVGEGVG